MKKILFLISFALFVVSSCSQKTDNELASTQPSHEEAITSLIADIDNLNYEFKINQTKGGLRNAILTAAADRAGGMLGSWIGGHIGAGLGVVTANPVVGVVGYLGGRKIGSVAGFAAASYLADIVLNNQSDYNSDPNCSFYLSLYDALYNQVSMEVDIPNESNYSVGEVHNMILAKLSTNGKTYRNEDGSFNTDELYNDAVQLETQIGINSTISSNDTYKNTFLSFYQDVITAAQRKVVQRRSDEQYKEDLIQATINRGLPADEVREITCITDMLIASADLEHEDKIAYGQEFAVIVENSSLPEREKSAVIEAGSVTIFSIEYWND